MIKNQFQTSIIILRTDNGNEYINVVLGKFLSTNGIIHQKSCVDTPQQNGVAERKNRPLLEVAWSLLFSMNVRKIHWRDAILTTTYLINRMPSKVLNFKTPIIVFPASFLDS